MEIHRIQSIDLFVGSAERPLQLVRVTLVNRGPEMLRRPASEGAGVTVRVDGDGVATPAPALLTDLGPGAERTVDVAVAVEPGLPEGTTRSVQAVAEGPGVRARAAGQVVVATPGWTMYMVPHFHYDPVWWNTQAAFTARWDELPEARAHRKADMGTAFDLVAAHLAMAGADPDYRFVLAELDYLKPYWDARPADRARLRRLLAEGRVELVGGAYNEPNTNLTSLESTIRNAVYGIGYQHEVLGGDPRTAWQLDVFGHDPAYPGAMADAGLTSSAWARGPFHQWGPKLTVGDNARMQFPSEFEWVSPDGRGLLTAYMANHYGAGWAFEELATLADAEVEAYRQFLQLKVVAVTRNVLLPVGGDHVIPSTWATRIQRDWNARYLWPRFVVGLPREFFAAVREELGRRQVALTPQTRDMNPVYTGKDVSYIDTKQAQRAAENAVLDAEKLATLAALLGARYPAEALDKAWRQLLFGAHHDGITGSESDQVYLDLLAGWREAYDLGAGARDAAVDHIGTRVDTTGEGTPVLVVNPLSWPRTDVATVTVRFPGPGPAGAAVRDDTGREVPAVLEAGERHPDGTLVEVTVAFLARDVPATGYRTYRVVPVAGQGAVGWSQAPGTAARSDHVHVEADPAHGGALTRVVDLRTGKDLLQPGRLGNEVVVHEEYPQHPDFAEGPWHLLSTGRAAGSAGVPAAVRVETSPVGERLVATWSLQGFRCTQEVTLWHGLDRVDLRTHVDGSIGQDRLLRVRFPVAVEGGRPVYEVGNAVVGRSFGFPDVDVAVAPWTLDNPAYDWFGVGSTARVELRDGGAVRLRHAIGVAEVVAAASVDAAAVRDLVAALAAKGVTSTCGRPEGPRYGALEVDSNLPDVRVAVGGPEENAFTAAVLDASDEAYAKRLAELVASNGSALVWVPAVRTRAETWVPNADVRGVRDLPVLIVAGRDASSTATAVAALAADMDDATIGVGQLAGPGPDGGEPLEDYAVALLNRGIPGGVVDASGAMQLSLVRSCSGWPCGVWIDPPRRTAPDGSSFAWQHWSHTFEYALVAGAGDWRDAGFVRKGHEYNHPLLARTAQEHPGELPPAASLLEVEPAEAVLTALKPRGNPLAAGRSEVIDPTAGVTLRCYDSTGRGTRARVRCLVPLRDGADVDVLETRRGSLRDAGDGVLRLRLRPAATVTATAVPDPAPGAPAPGVGAPEAPTAELGPRREPAQPVHTRYWLHNKGPAPFGYQPVSVYVEPRALRLAGTCPARVTVSAGSGRRRGRLELIASPGIEVDAPQDLSYALDGDPADGGPAGGEYARFDLAVRPSGEPPAGRYFLAARIADEHGQVLEDVLALDIGPVPAAEPELAVRLETPTVRLAPGEHGAVRLRLANPCRDEVRGEAQLVSPYGTWEMLSPWTRGLSVPGGGEQTLAYDVRVPATARQGAYWALVKVMYFGRLHYTKAIPITVARRE